MARIQTDMREKAGRRLAFQEGVRVRFTREPHGVVDGVSLDRYHAGRAYEMSAELAEYLVLEGYASIEMRRTQRSRRHRPRDRRRRRT